MSVENGDDVPDLFEHAENADEAIADFKGAKEIDAEQQQQARSERRQEVATDQTTQAWLEAETEADTDAFDFRGRSFEFKQPGIIHRKRMIQIASESNLDEFEDVDPADADDVDEALEETFDDEGLKTVDELYDHTLRALCDLCCDDYMGAEGNIGPEESALTSDEMPLGASRWGELPEDAIEDDEGNIVKKGVGDLFRAVVMERGADEDAGGN